MERSILGSLATNAPVTVEAHQLQSAYDRIAKITGGAMYRLMLAQEGKGAPISRDLILNELNGVRREVFSQMASLCISTQLSSGSTVS